MYIDNELSLAEKIKLLEHSHSNREFVDTAVKYIEQEKMLRNALIHEAPEIETEFTKSKKVRLFSFHSIGWALAACLLLFFTFTFNSPKNIPETVHDLTATVPHRFVIQQDGSKKVEITGSFVNWERLPLTPSGALGYWEISLEIPPGEHRYTFIIDGVSYLPDPTVVDQEPDGFGEINSILKIGA